MVARGDGDLAEMLRRHPGLVHVAAHDERDLAIGSHHAERHLEVARVRRLRSGAAVLAERCRSRDNQNEIDDSGVDHGGGMSQEGDPARSAVAAGQRDRWRDPQDVCRLLGPERLGVVGRVDRREPLTVEIFFR